MGTGGAYSGLMCCELTEKQADEHHGPRRLYEPGQTNVVVKKPNGSFSDHGALLWDGMALESPCTLFHVHVFPAADRNRVSGGVVRTRQRHYVRGRESRRAATKPQGGEKELILFGAFESSNRHSARFPTGKVQGVSALPPKRRGLSRSICASLQVHVTGAPTLGRARLQVSSTKMTESWHQKRGRRTGCATRLFFLCA